MFLCVIASRQRRTSPRAGSVATSNLTTLYLYLMEDILLIEKSITINELKEIASKRYGDLVKAVVDIDKKIMAIGGEMHADEEKFLLEYGSLQDNLWGINIYPDFDKESRIEFDSVINIRPRQQNRSRSVEDEGMQKLIIEIVNELIS